MNKLNWEAAILTKKCQPPSTNLGTCGPQYMWTVVHVDRGACGPRCMWTSVHVDLGACGPRYMWTSVHVDLSACGPQCITSVLGLAVFYTVVLFYDLFFSLKYKLYIYDVIWFQSGMPALTSDMATSGSALSPHAKSGAPYYYGPHHRRRPHVPEHPSYGGKFGKLLNIVKMINLEFLLWHLW